MDGTPKKKPNLLVRLLAFLFTLALMLGAVAAVAYRDQFNIDALRRYIAYRNLERTDSGQAKPFQYEGGSGSVFAPVDGGLLVCSPTSIHLYSSSGTEYVNQTVEMERPVVSSAGSYGLAYDAGGTALFLFHGNEIVFTLDLEYGRTLLSADVNEAGWLTVVAQESGYKGTVTVYDSQYRPAIKIRLSSSFVLDGAVSPNNQSVALAAAGLDGGAFTSRIDLYRLNRDASDPSPDHSISIGNSLCLDLLWNDDGIWSLGENSLSHLDEDTLLGRYDFSGRYLKNYSLGGDGFAVLLLGKYRAGSSADLTVVDEAGAAAATLPLNSQVLSLSAAGRYIAVLTADRLDIYTKDLTLYNRLDATQGAQRVIQRPDGSALLISSGDARLYLPE